MTFSCGTNAEIPSKMPAGIEPTQKFGCHVTVHMVVDNHLPSKCKKNIPQIQKYR